MIIQHYDIAKGGLVETDENLADAFVRLVVSPDAGGGVRTYQRELLVPFSVFRRLFATPQRTQKPTTQPKAVRT